MDPTLPVLTDEEFETLDTDGDGVVHLESERVLGNYPFPDPPLTRERKGQDDDGRP
jgi:hypothetical protein